MSPNMSRKRIKLSKEQRALLKAAFKNGLTGIGKEHEKELEELQRKTDLPIKTVQKGILNLRRGRQNKKQRVVPSFSADKGKSHFTGYNLFCKETGSLSSDDAERHAKWSALWKALTDAQRNDYNSRAKALNERSLSDLTEAEQQIIAEAIVKNIGKEVVQLQDLGCHAFFVAHSTESSLCHGTNVGLEVWSEIRDKVILSFHKKITGPAKLPPSKTGTNELRIKVQDKMSQLYGAFINKPPTLFPYTLFEEGKLNIKVSGLPSGLESLKTPGSMGRNQMEAFLAADISFEAMSEEEVSNVNPANLDDDHPPQILEQQVTGIPMEQIPLQAPPSSSDIQPSQIFEQLSMRMPLQVISSQDNNTTNIPNANGSDSTAFIIDENMLVKDSSVRTYESDNEVEVESCSPSEALQRAVSFAKEVEQKMLPQVNKKRKKRMSYMKSLVGCRVSQLWKLSDGKKDWFDGTIIETSDAQYAVVFDGETQKYSLSAAKTKRLLEKKTLRFL